MVEFNKTSEIFRNASWRYSGEVNPALELPLILQLDRIFCVVFGIPLNLISLRYVRSVINHRESGHSGIFWTTVILFNCWSLFQSLTELAIYFLNQEGWYEQRNVFCQIYSIFVGCPYALLLTTLTLGTADRYTALAHTQFYRSHITKKKSFGILIFIIIIIVGGHSSPYWIGYFQLDDKCQMHSGWLALTLTFHAFMSGVCFVLQIRLYIFTRSCINYSTTATDSTHTSSRPISSSNVDARNAVVFLNPASSTASSYGRRHQSTAPIRRSNRKITGPEGQQLSRLEVRAARTLTLGILPFCLINLPIAVFFAVFHFTRLSLDLENINRWFFIILICLRELILFHLMYIPIVAMFVIRIESKSKRRSRHYFRRRDRRPEPMMPAPIIMSRGL